MGLSLVLVLASAMVLGALLAGAVLATRALSGAPAEVVETAGVLAWVVLAVLMVLVLGVLYRVAPDRRLARWRWVSPGAVTATVLWSAASVALFAYVRSLGTYETTYGSLAGVAISMLWLWLTVLLVLVGAVSTRRPSGRPGATRRWGPSGRPASAGRWSRTSPVDAVVDLTGGVPAGPILTADESAGRPRRASGPAEESPGSTGRGGG